MESEKYSRNEKSQEMAKLKIRRSRKILMSYK